LSNAVDRYMFESVFFMTHFIKPYFLVFIYLSGFSQEKDLDNLVISLDRVYLGLYGEQLVRTDSAHVFNRSTLRAGALLSRNFNDKLKIRSFALMKLETNELIKSSGSFEMVYQPNSSNRIQLGYVGTAFSELRPNPLTPESQTEYITQGEIPGAKPNIKYSHSFNETSSFATGFSFNNSLLGYQFKFSHKDLVLGFQLEKYNMIGAFDYQLKGFKSISVYNYSRKEYNQALIYRFNEYQFYIEGELNSIDTNQNFELGVRSNFMSYTYHIKGFIGLAYNNYDKLISCSLFINFKEDFFIKH